MLLHSQPREALQGVPREAMERLGNSLDLSLVEEVDDGTSTEI